MATYTYPGVYIEELPSGPGPITGTSPSGAGMVGWTLEGPANKPTLCTSFPDFARKFGGFTTQSKLPTSVYAFFANGGSEAQIVRVAPPDATSATTFLYVNGEERPLPLDPQYLPDGARTYFAWTGEYAADLLPMVPGSVKVSNYGGGASGEVWRDRENGSPTGTITPGVLHTSTSPLELGTIDYETGEITLNYDPNGGQIPVALSNFEIECDYKTFSFEMTWPGVVGNQFRINISGDPAFEIVESATYSRYIFEVQRDEAGTGVTWNTVETYSGVSFTDPTSGDFITTVLNAKDSGSNFVTCTGYGNNIAPPQLSGAGQTDDLVPAPPTPNYDGANKQFAYAMPTNVMPFTLRNFNIQLDESGVHVGSGVNPAQGSWASTAPLPGWNGGVAGNNGDTQLGAYIQVNFTTENGGNLTSRTVWNTDAAPVGAAPAGSYALGTSTAVTVGWYDPATGDLAINQLNAITTDPIAAGSSITVDVSWQNALKLEDDGNGNMVVSDDNAGPNTWSLNPNGDNTISYGEIGLTTATVNFMVRTSVDPNRGPVPPLPDPGSIGIDQGQGTFVRSDWFTQASERADTEEFAGGSDGSAITRSVVTAPVLEIEEKGLYALNTVETVLNVTIPDFETDPTVSRELVEYCERRKDRFAVISVPQGLDANQAANYKKVTLNSNSSYAALYYPHLQIIDPATNRASLFPPGGHVCGIYARTDQQRNVSKAPAGTVDGSLRFTTGLEFTLTTDQVGVTNMSNVNSIVQWPYTGRAVWGARTLEAGGSWPYIQMRRMFMYVQKAVYQSTWGYIFETNNPGLQTAVRLTVENFLLSLFNQGYFSGTSPQQAFFVICDASNNPPENIAKGILTCDVGIAPTRPAEFIVFRFQQKALE